MYVQSLTNRPPAFYGALLAATLLPLYAGSYWYRLGHPYGGTNALATTPLDTARFLEDWLNVRVVQPFNPSAIAAYCNRTDWHPNLVFNLVDGGEASSAHTRGSVLDFVFYAIEAGASIVVPSFGTNNSPTSQGKAAFHMLYDEDWLIQAMRIACPQMAVYRPEGNEEMAGGLPGVYLPKSRRLDVDMGNTKEVYLEHLDAWLEGIPSFNPDKLALVNVKSTQWQVDTRSLPQGFRRNFGQVLRTPPEIRRFAARSVQKLAARYHTTVDPRLAIPKDAFYGAQLCTRNSSASEAYSNISAQAEAHIARAIERQLKLIYVASENDTELATFKIAAARHATPLIAVSSFDLLSPIDGAALKQLSWTQQALVESEVLQRCSVFGGSVQSAASYSIALTRNQWLVDLNKINDPWFVKHEDPGVTFDDGLSRLLGRESVSEQQIARGCWP